MPKRRLILSLVLVLLITLLVVAPTASSRSLSVGNVYVSYPTWMANCPGGGKVIGIHAANGMLWSTPPQGDWGDDLIYPRVNLNARNPISAQLYCKRPWYTADSKDHL
jgi:hypothetical protein